MIELVLEGDQWRIATEYPIFPGPAREEPLDAQRLVAMLDAAQIKRAVVLCVGYWFDSPTKCSPPRLIFQCRSPTCGAARISRRMR
jgi:hypothetical protein